MPVRRAVPLWLLTLGLVFGAEPPAIRRQGVVNAASQRPAAVGGAIARGTLVSIHGVRFASEIRANRVVLESAGQSRTLTVLRADPQRLEAWIPPDAPLGQARLTVSANGLASPPEAVTILKSAPGLFSANGQGWGPARSVNVPANSVAPGGTVTLQATGLAPSDTPAIHLGPAVARVISVRAAKGPDYTAEITIQVPPDAPEGCYVPVYAGIPGAPPSNTVTISVHRGGGACVSPPDDPASGWEGGKTAILSLSRTVRRTLDAPEDRIEDEVNAGFFDVPPDKARASPLLLLPPPGSCATYAGVLNAGTPVGGSVWTLLFGGVLSEGLDAGTSIVVRSQSVQLRVPFVSGAMGLYRRMLSAGQARGFLRNRLSFDSGKLGIAGTGGAQVGPFTVSLPAPVAFTAEIPPADPVVRSRAVTVEWAAANSGGTSEGTMVIALIAADANLNVAGLTYCNAPKAAGRFTIAPDLLAQLPAGRGDLVMASWWGRAISPPPTGIARMMGLSVFAHSSEVRIE